jgi:hypothetical protein
MTFDAFVFTGYLADVAEPEACHWICGQVEPISKELGAGVCWVMGNHDDRAPYARELFDEESDGSTHARDLDRPLGVVPGPIMCGQSAGSHRLLRCPTHREPRNRLRNDPASPKQMFYPNFGCSMRRVASPNPRKGGRVGPSALAIVC